MVFKRKLDCQSVGFDFPNIPRAPRSCRRNVLNKRTDDDTQICAIDFLASLAGKLLQECQSSSASSNAFEGNNHEKQEDKYKSLKSESSDQGNSVSRPIYEYICEKCVVNSFSFPDSDNILERTSMSDYKEFHGLTGETGGVNVSIDGLGDGGLITDTCNLEDAAALGVQCPESVRVGGVLKLPSFMDMTPNGSFVRHGNHTNLGRKDDDEKFLL